jgi:hypothetical protein
VAEWLRSGLQSRLLRFESGRRLSPDRWIARAQQRASEPDLAIKRALLGRGMHLPSVGHRGDAIDEEPVVDGHQVEGDGVVLLGARFEVMAYRPCARASPAPGAMDNDRSVYRGAASRSN